MWQVTGESDSRRPRHPGEPPDDEELFIVEGSKKSAHPGTPPLSGESEKWRKMHRKAPNSASKLSLNSVDDAPPLLSARTSMSTTLSVNATAEHCCGTTGMSGTLSRELKRARTVRLGLLEHGLHDHSNVHKTTGAAPAAIPQTCRSTKRAQQRGPRTVTVESQRSSAQQRCAYLSLCIN